MNIAEELQIRESIANYDSEIERLEHLRQEQVDQLASTSVTDVQPVRISPIYPLGGVLFACW